MKKKLIKEPLGLEGVGLGSDTYLNNTDRKRLCSKRKFSSCILLYHKKKKYFLWLPKLLSKLNTTVFLPGEKRTNKTDFVTNL